MKLGSFIIAEINFDTAAHLIVSYWLRIRVTKIKSPPLLSNLADGLWLEKKHRKENIDIAIRTLNLLNPPRTVIPL